MRRCPHSKCRTCATAQDAAARAGVPIYENEQLAETRQGLIEARDAAQKEAAEAHEQIAALRTDVASMEQNLKTLRAEMDAQREAVRYAIRELSGVEVQRAAEPEDKKIGTLKRDRTGTGGERQPDE